LSPIVWAVLGFAIGFVLAGVLVLLVLACVAGHVLRRAEEEEPS
jgi:hypothetical protein